MLISANHWKSVSNESNVSVSEVIITLSWWQEFFTKVNNVALVTNSLAWLPQGCR